MQVLPIQILVLQSTAFCNIDCDYCYLPNRTRKGQMMQSVLERVSSEIIRGGYWRPSSLVLWHAGEPMVLGVEWYRNAHRTLDSGSGRLKRIQFQSNATLLDGQWSEFLQRENAGIGVSIDGPQWLHDRHRKNRAGRGTFESAMKGVTQLKAAGIPFTNIATLTKDALDAPDEIFDFFVALQPMKLAFSIEEAEGSNSNSSLYQADMLGRVEEFFRRIAERNFQLSNPLRVREIEGVIAGLIAPPGQLGKSQESQLGRILAIGASGDVAVFSPELLTTVRRDGRCETVGNILHQTLEEILSGEPVRRLSEQIQAGVSACQKSCTYFDQCGGGSPANKYYETGRYDASETWYCKIARQATVRGVKAAINAARTAASIIGVRESSMLGTLSPP